MVRRVTRGSVTASLAAVVLAALSLSAPLSSPAAAAVLAANDFCLGECNDILPPGENGNATLADILAHQALGTRPAHSGDQLGRYANLVYNYAGLTDAQIDRLLQQGPRGAQLFDDVQSYVAGINAYIAACMAARNCPGEYVLTGHLDAITNAGGPERFKPTDLIATGGVVGGLFGGGGGGEIQSALVRIAARARYGVTEGDRVWAGFRSQNDPETVLTLHDGQSFPYGLAAPDAPGVAMPDPGSVTPEPIVFDPTGSATTTSANKGALGTLKLGSGMSNAVVISGAQTTSGHPVAVFGPQTGYFSPQLLMLEELQGPGISARGVAFAGLKLYVQIGRGPDYAWSATSAEQDLTDTFAVPLCTVDGSAPTVRSDHYLYHGQCLSMEVLEQVNAWSPTVADGTAAGSYRLVALRTKYGLVTARAMLGGQPVAYTALRSTYRHEADSALFFAACDDPARMATAQGFQQAAGDVGYAFNWFYVNSTDAAYYDSGLNPVRASGADPNLPVRADPAYEWQGWDPDTNTAAYTPPAQHPNSVNQDYYVSWNNKQARDYSAADGNFSFGPVFRADLLEAPVRAAVHNGQKLDRAGVVRIMEDAAATDLRGRRVLGTLLRVLSSQPVTDPRLATVVTQLQAWQQSGARRMETTPGSHVYQHADAIRVFDAWWPRLAAAQFQPGLGSGLYAALAATLPVDEAPSGVMHHGSAYQSGRWGWHRRRCTRVTRSARRGTSGAPTRSSSSRSAASPTRSSRGRTGRPTSRWCRSRRIVDGCT